MSKPVHECYKLVREMKDGTFAPLFIHQSFRFDTSGKWMEAQDKPTKGFAHRPGFHCTLTPSAPHLGEEGRRWLKCEADDYEFHERPAAQGGRWLLAKKLRVVAVL